MVKWYYMSFLSFWCGFDFCYLFYKIFEWLDLLIFCGVWCFMCVWLWGDCCVLVWRVCVYKSSLVGIVLLGCFCVKVMVV